MDEVQGSSHELFARGIEGEDEEIRKIDFIYLRRFANRKDPKDFVQIPGRWKPTELVGWLEVHKLFGGGCYQAVGMTKQHRYCAFSEIIALPGAPRALDASEVPEVSAPPETQQPRSNDGIAGVLSTMLQLQMQQNQQNQQMQLEYIKLLIVSKQGGESKLSNLVELANLAKTLRGSGDDVKSTLEIVKSFQSINPAQDNEIGQLLSGLTGLMTKAGEQTTAKPAATAVPEDWIEIMHPNLGLIRMTRAQVAALMTNAIGVKPQVAPAPTVATVSAPSVAPTNGATQTSKSTSGGGSPSVTSEGAPVAAAAQQTAGGMPTPAMIKAALADPEVSKMIPEEAKLMMASMFS